MKYNLESKQKPAVYFISGVCGTGKSSTIKYLKLFLPEKDYDIRDFDERGVPDGGGLTWHNSETKYWLEVASTNAKDNRSTIICGFANPETFELVYGGSKYPPALIFLLNASGEMIKKRLSQRHNTKESIEEINRASGVKLEKFIEDNIEFAPKLKEIFVKRNLPIIETDNLTPEGVVRDIIKIIN